MKIASKGKSIKKETTADYLAVCVLVFVVGLVGLGLASFSTFADDEAGGHVSVNVPVSCMLTGDEVEAHSKNVLNGTNESGIGSTILTASCNDDNGFALYTIGFTDDMEGKNVLTNSVLGSEHDIVSGIATSGNISNWSMMITPESNPTYNISMQNGFSTYRTIPDSYTMVAKRESATDAGESATGANLTATYQTYISRTQMAGDYSGQVKFVLVHPHDEIILQPQPCEAGKICYHPNANPSMITGEMGKQSASNGTSVTLYASNFKRDGYGFAGWSDVYDYTTNPDAHFYGPNQTITAPADVETNGLSLYAVWIKSVGSMQSDITSVCNSLTVDPNYGTANLSTVSALTDDRDGNTYAIAKLADNKCWMIENLRLADKDSNGNDIILTSQNTHNPSLPLTNSWYYYSSQQSTLTTSNHLSSPTDPTQIAWCASGSSNCLNQSLLAANNTTLFVNNTATSYDASSDVFSYGIHYNWYSATAGHGKYGDSSYGAGFVAPGDICPANWRLPTGDAAGDFYVLHTAINGGTTGSAASNKLRSYPNSFIYSGVARFSSIGNRNEEGAYWSASGGNYDSAYRLGVSASGVSPRYTLNTKYSAPTVRCVSGN